MQCCGQPFSVGSAVTWTLSDEPDTDWLAHTVGESLAQRVSHSEDHHGDLAASAPTTNGRVAGITRAFCRYARPDADSRVSYPVPRTARLNDVDHANGWEDEADGLDFIGYLVALHVERPRSEP